MSDRAGERLAGTARMQNGFQMEPHRWRAASPWLVAVMGVVVAAGVGYVVGQGRAPASKPPAREAATRDERMELLIAGQTEVSRRLARLEEAAAVTPRGSAPSAPPASPSRASAEPPSEAGEHALAPQAIAAFDAAQAIVAEAVRSGRWSEDRRDRMRQTFGPLGDEGRQAILQELTAAINSGKISLVGVNGPPL